MQRKSNAKEGVRGKLRLKCDDTSAETRFRLSAKGTSPFKSAGASVQLTTGSRGVRIIGSNAGYTMFRGSVKGTGYPLYSQVSPSLSPHASPCTITFQLGFTRNYRTLEQKSKICENIKYKSRILDRRRMRVVGIENTNRKKSPNYSSSI